MSRPGQKNSLEIEVYGTEGALTFNLENLNELNFLDAKLPVREQGFRRILVNEPEHPYLEAWWPQGHIIGWEHTFTHQVRDFLLAIDSGSAPSPSFEEGIRTFPPPWSWGWAPSRSRYLCGCQSGWSCVEALL